MTTTIETRDAETTAIFSAINAFQKTIATGLLSEIEASGKLFAFLIQNDCKAPNVVAALLDELRAEYSRLYRAEYASAREAIAGVQVNEVGGFLVTREDRAEVAERNREKLANRRVFSDAQMREATKGADVRSTVAAYAARAQSERLAAAEAPRQELRTIEAPQGTFTVEHADGTYETVKIKTHDEGTMAGKTIASFLSGPDNESSFTGFAFVTPGGQVKVWSRFSGIDRRWIEAVETVIGGDNGSAREAYAIRSGKCSICGRKLTVPASLHQGMGPDCFAKYGG